VSENPRHGVAVDPRILAEIVRSNRRFVMYCKCVVAARRKGASIRVIARCFGQSKSALHRDLPMIEAVAAAADAHAVPGGTGAAQIMQENQHASVPDGTAKASE